MQKTWIYGLAGASLLLGACAQTPKYPPIVVTEPLVTPTEIREKITQGAAECSASIKTTRKTAVAIQDCINMVTAKTSKQYGFPSSNVVTQYGFTARLNAVQYAEGKISRTEFEVTSRKALADLWVNADIENQQKAQQRALEAAQISAQQAAASIQRENEYMRQQMIWQGFVKDVESIQKHDEERRQKVMQDYMNNRPRTTTCNKFGMGIQCTTN